MNNLITILTILFFAIPVFAQNEAGVDMNGKTALSFETDGLDLANFDSGIGGRKWVSEQNVMFFSLCFNKEKVDMDHEFGEYLTEKDRAFGLSIGMESHFGTKEKLSPYLGFSLGVRYDKAEGEDLSKRITTLNKTRSFSSDLIFGLEYWPVKRISIAAQYTAGFNYSKSRSIFTDTNYYLTDIDKCTSFESSGTRLIISLYLN